MSDDSKVTEMPAAPPPRTKANIAVCPYCGTEIGTANIRFDPTPAGTYLLQFICTNQDCRKLLGIQLATKETLFGSGNIEIPSGPRIPPGMVRH